MWWYLFAFAVFTFRGFYEVANSDSVPVVIATLECSFFALVYVCLAVEEPFALLFARVPGRLVVGTCG
jgi:hypothetical protein